MSSYQDGNSPTSVAPSLVLVSALYKVHLEFTKRCVGPNYVEDLVVGVHKYLSGKWEGLIGINIKNTHVMTRLVCVPKCIILSLG